MILRASSWWLRMFPVFFLLKLECKRPQISIMCQKLLIKTYNSTYFKIQRNEITKEAVSGIILSPYLDLLQDHYLLDYTCCLNLKFYLHDGHNHKISLWLSHFCQDALCLTNSKDIWNWTQKLILLVYLINKFIYNILIF